jgi:hypothetical protein
MIDDARNREREDYKKYVSLVYAWGSILNSHIQPFLFKILWEVLNKSKWDRHQLRTIKIFKSLS